MVDIYPPTVQRPALLKLVERLVCQPAALRRDECDDWRVNGEDGHIYAVPGSLERRKTPGFQIFVFCETVRQWSAVKSAMTPFTDITNDGDREGAFFLDRLPTAAEAETIRRYVGLRKKREDTEEALARLRSSGDKTRFQAKRPRSDRHRVL
jgi:hypothetical protein